MSELQRPSIMQTFRAYLQEEAGAITWAAWIDAFDLSEAIGKAQLLCGAKTPTVDLWFATERRPKAGAELVSV